MRGSPCLASRAVTRCQTQPQESCTPRGSWQWEGNETNSMFLFFKGNMLLSLLRSLKKRGVGFVVFFFFLKPSATVVCNHMLNSLCPSSFSPSLMFSGEAALLAKWASHSPAMAASQKLVMCFYNLYPESFADRKNLLTQRWWDGCRS